MSKKLRLPLCLQFFAEGEEGAQTGQTQAGQQDDQQAGQNIDYDKIQQMLDGTLKAKEDVALNAYFKQQGLSQEDARLAIETFKQQKADQQPDVAALQTQATQSQERARQAVVEKEAVLAAVELGLDSKSIPYVLRMADLSQAVGTDEKINAEALKTALSKVLEDIPALKPAGVRSGGFMYVGAGGQQQQQASAADSELDRIFGTKKTN